MRAIGMRTAIAIAVAAGALALGLVPASAEMPDPAARPACTTPPVSTPAGRFCGLAVTFKDEGAKAHADAYEGIRYAMAKRWTAPRPVPASSTLVKATAFGPVCPQPPVDGIAQSEDCLSLNLWTPTRSTVKGLPVMVFIHGGSFVDETGSLPIYDGARLATRSDVIIVTINYRLGALGFLAGGKGTDKLAGNYGIRDQQAALGWVRDNIRGFGGDPAKVTIFGESAGAMSVGTHLVAPASQTLFRRAIMESNPYGVPFKTPPQAGQIRTEFDMTRAAAPCKGRIACLRKLPAAQIVKAQSEVQPSLSAFTGKLGEILAWAPTVDGSLIPSQPNAAALSKRVIAGTNRDEGTLFVDEALPNGLSNSEYSALIVALFKTNAAFILTAARYSPDGKGNLVPLANLIGDYFFSCATRHVLAASKAPVFGYAFDHRPSYAEWPQAPAACQPGSGPNRGRVCHGFELPFVFRNPITLSLPTRQHHFTPAEQVLVNRISDYWTGLAEAGDPNAGDGTPPDWPRYGAPGTRQVLNLKISQTTDAELSCPLWDMVGYGPGAVSLY